MGKLEILKNFGESAKVKTFDFSNKGGSTDTILLVVGAIVVALIIALIASSLMKK